MPVLAKAAEKRDVPLQVTAIGSVEPFSAVAVRSQVAGEVSEVHFREGQNVRKGDLLFTIDPRPFEAALRQAESALARDRAQAANASEEARRYESLAEKGYVSRQEYDRLRTSAAALEAVVRADEAAVEHARLQLAYTAIRSPLSGRTGAVQVQAGNVVKASEAVLVTINQIAPVQVAFSVPEQELAEVRKRAASGRLRVEAAPAGGTARPLAGSLAFIDNKVNTQTGTILLKATFPNRDGALWPGQFVDVVVVLATERDRTVVPRSAVQTGQQGRYVYVIKDDGTAELRTVEVARSFGDQAVIGKGVAPGETVVTEGQLRLVPGAKVEIKPSAAGQAEGKPKSQSTNTK